jgi:hypothetical protein
MAGRSERVSEISAGIMSQLSTRKAFADEARISERSLDRLISAGDIPIVRLDRAVLIDVEAGRAALAARK